MRIASVLLLSAAAGAIYLTRKKPTAPKPTERQIGGLSTGPQCFPGAGANGLSPADSERIRKSLERSFNRAPAQLKGSALAYWAAAEAMAELCPRFGTPSSAVQVENYRAANGKDWSRAHEYAVFIASSWAVPPPV